MDTKRFAFGFLLASAVISAISLFMRRTGEDPRPVNASKVDSKSAISSAQRPIDVASGFAAGSGLLDDDVEQVENQSVDAPRLVIGQNVNTTWAIPDAGETIDGSDNLPQGRRWINAYIKRVGNESFDETVANLGVYEGVLAHACFSLRGGSGRSNPLINFQRCLGNRRLAKVYEELGHWPSNDASAFVKARFELARQKFDNDIERFLREWETDGKVSEPVDLSRDQKELESTVFLLAAYGRTEDLLDAIDRWVNVSRAAVERATFDERLVPVAGIFRDYGMPQLLYLVNIYIWILLERCGLQDAHLVLTGCDFAENPTIEEVAFVGWDGHTNNLDWTHIPSPLGSGVPIDTTRILRKFQVCRSWRPTRPLADDDQGNVVTFLRGKIH